MRRHILAAVIACILGIVMLAALACYILISQRQTGLVTLDPDDLFGTEGETGTGLLGEFTFQTEGPGETLPVLTAAQAGLSGATEPETGAAAPADADETEENGTAYPAGSSTPAEHRILFVGDSRTLGMRDALGRADRSCQDVFVGRVGEGVRWFREEGIDEMNAAIRDNPELPVVLNFGVNDPLEINNYIVTYWDCIRQHPDTDFYILSVNPIDEEFLLEEDLVLDSVLEQINNLNIARMNIRLKKEFGRRYLDSASFLRTDGFDTVDGLHFSTETYLKIHDFVVRALFSDPGSANAGASGPAVSETESAETARERVG